MAGPYPVRVTIRMPVVVPGRAEIIVGVQTPDTVQVDFAPIASETATDATPLRNSPNRSGPSEAFSAANCGS